mgnify:CR=1 FL=1
MPDSTDLIALDEALEKLARHDHVKADLVKLRYFAGLTEEQATQALGISRARQVNKDAWVSKRKARQ